MKNKLKIISIFTLVLAIVISFTSSCFASGASEPFASIVVNGDKYDLYFEYMDQNYGSLDLDTYNNYVVVKNEVDGVIKNYVVCFFSDNTVKFSTHASDYPYNLVSNCGSTGFRKTGKLYTFNLDITTKKGTLRWGRTDIFDGYNYACCDVDDIVYSTFDIYSKENEDELVFQKTPVGVQSTLAPIVQEAPLEGTVQEIVGILPIVLIILIGLIGLRKGLALLSQTLHKA